MLNQLLSKISSRVEEELRNYTSSAVSLNQSNAQAFETGEINLKQKQSLLERFSQQVVSLPHITTVHLGNNLGAFYGAGIAIDGSLHSDFSDEENNYREPFFDYVKNKYSVEQPRVFDARTRDWYQTGSKAKKQAWGEIYAEFRGKRRVLANSYPIYRRDKELQAVLALSIGLYHFDEFLKNLEIAKIGQVFILEKSGGLVSTSGSSQPLEDKDEPNELFHLTNIQDKLTRITGELLLQQYNNNLAQIDKPQQLSFDFNGEKHLLEIAPFSDEYGLDWLIVVVVPERRLL